MSRFWHGHCYGLIIVALVAAMYLALSLHGSSVVIPCDIKDFDQVVSAYLANLTHDEKVTLSRLNVSQLDNYHVSHGASIRDQFCLWDNRELRRSCSRAVIQHDEAIHPEDVSYFIVYYSWKRLTHHD